MTGKTQQPPAIVPSAASRAAVSSTARVVRSLQRSRKERRTLYAIAGAVVGVWLVVVFANALGVASDASGRLAQEQRVNATLVSRAAAGAAEIERISEPSFLEFLARSYGMGELAEHPFALTPGAPAPPSMVPLGASMDRESRSTPLDDWLELLVGS